METQSDVWCIQIRCYFEQNCDYENSLRDDSSKILKEMESKMDTADVHTSEDENEEDMETLDIPIIIDE